MNKMHYADIYYVQEAIFKKFLLLVAAYCGGVDITWDWGTVDEEVREQKESGWRPIPIILYSWLLDWWLGVDSKMWRISF